VKILIVSMFPLEGAGSGTYCRSMACKYISEGNEVFMLLPRSAYPQEVPGVHVVSVDPCPGKPFPVFTDHPESSRVFDDLTEEEITYYLRTYDGAIRGMIREYGIDRIHFQHLWLTASLAGDLPVPSIVTCHGTDIRGFQMWPRFGEYFRKSIDGCEEVVAVSHSQGELLLELCPDIAGKLNVVLNRHDPAIFHKKEVDRRAVLQKLGCENVSQKVLLFAGKINRTKGVDVLLDAMLVLKNEQPASRQPLLILAGSGRDMEQSVGFCRKNCLDNVIFAGFVPQEELADLMNAADLFIMPSRYEPFGLSAQEAMACGLYVIASDVDGLSEIVTPGKGVLIPPGDPRCLADAIASLALFRPGLWGACPA